MKKYHPSLHTTPFIFEGDFKTTGGQRAVAEIMRLRPRPTAIVSGNDLMAIGALRELKSAGLRVPQDVSVIGFDDITFAALAEPQLTTIMLPRAEIGEAAVEALMHDRGRGQLGREFRVSTQLVVRESTGAAAGKAHAEDAEWAEQAENLRFFRLFRPFRVIAVFFQRATMNLTAIDWVIMLVYFVFVLGIGFALKRYMKTSTDFFSRGARSRRGSRAGLHLGQPRRRRSSGWGPRGRSTGSRRATSTGSARSRRWSSSASS